MTRISLAACIAGALALGACGTPPQFEGTEAAPPDGQSRTATGAVIGGLLGGAVAGPITGGGAGKTAAGAAAGAAIGGLIGNRLDRQAAELDAELGDGITVDNQGDRLLVSFPQDILFAVNSSALSQGARSELRDLAASLQRYPDTNVEIVGHTDNTGEAAFNFDLSTRRAGAVAAVLVDGGVEGRRITATGRGEDEPVASNLTEEGRAQNRRVEVVIRPIT